MFVRATFFSLLLTIGTLIALPAKAASLLRDPDIEYSLRKLATPILNAAGLSPNSVRILLVNDRSLNAFVIDNKSIFIHSGLLLKLTSASQLQAIIAHEAAHISNGHITRRIGNARSANRFAAFGVLLAAAVAASGEAQAGAGLAAGAVGSARGVFLSHTRAEESSADQSALRYMSRAKIPLQSIAEVFEIFRGQEALNVSRQDPYARTHPIGRDRIRAIKGTIAGARTYTEDPKFTYWFARAQGKLSAFTRAPNWTLRRAKSNSDIDAMRRAIAWHRGSSSRKAKQGIASLVAKNPKDPFLRELQGQILLENRDFGAAVNAYDAGVRLSPNQSLILGGLGRSLLTLKTKSADKRALNVLIKARSRDNRDAGIMRDLAVVYARTGNPGMASLVTAERYALRGDLKNARIQAKRASGLLPRGSAPRRRAQDILDSTRPR